MNDEMGSIWGSLCVCCESESESELIFGKGLLNLAIRMLMATAYH